MDSLLSKMPHPPMYRVMTSSQTNQSPILTEGVATEEREIEDLVQSGWNHEQHREKLKVILYNKIIQIMYLFYWK